MAGIQFRKRKSDGQAFPLKSKKSTISSNPNDRSKGVKMGKGFKIPSSDGSMTKEIKVWKFEDAPDDLQEKILEKMRNINVEDSILYADDDFLLGHDDIFKWNTNKLYFELDRDQYIQFTDLQILDNEKFRKRLRIPKDLWDKVEYRFVNERENNTELDFYENDNAGEEGLSDTEKQILEDAKEKFSDIIHEGYIRLKNNYEYAISDDAVRDTIEANEYTFDQYGDIA